MAGSSSITGLESIIFADNASFNGTERGGAMTLDGQLWIGSTALPHVRLGQIISPTGTVTIGYVAPNIHLDVDPGDVVMHLVGDDAVQVGPDNVGNIYLTTEIVANSTNASPLYSLASAATIETLQLALSTASAVTNDQTLSGISYFDDSHFTVNADGYVQLVTPPETPSAAFQAQLTANINNVLGNNVVYDVVFNSVTFDITTSFDAGTGVFTAPSNGIYSFDTTITIGNLNNNAYDLGASVGIITPTREFYGDEVNTFFIAQNQDEVQLSASALCELLAGDTVYVSAVVQSTGASPQTINILRTSNAVPQSYFSGFKVSNISTTGLNSITGDDAVGVGPDATGNIDLLTNVVANSTYALPVWTHNSAANTEMISVQVSTESAVTNDNTLGGICYFDSADFTVNADGYVQFVGGGGGGIETITGDDLVAVTALAGNINLTTGTVANSLNPTPLYSYNSIPNTETIEIQLSTNSATTNNSYLAGISYYDTSQFTVNANGFVTLAGGGAIQTLTGDDGIVVGPAGGNINLLSSVVLSGTNITPVYTINSAANTETIEVQVSTASNNNNDFSLPGLAYFDDTQFTVNAAGYVQLVGGGGGSGSIVQEVRAESTTSVATTASFPTDSAPGLANCASVITLAITPTNAANILKFSFTTVLGANADCVPGFFLFNGATLLSSKAYWHPGGLTDAVTIDFDYYMVAGTVLPTTFDIRMNSGGAGISKRTLKNGLGAGVNLYGGNVKTQITITEVLP